MKSLNCLCAMLILGACASHNKRVSCDGHLEPINTPAPVGRVEQTSANTTAVSIDSSARDQLP